MRPRLSEFFGLDLRSLAVFRIGLGAMIVADLVKRSLTLEAHYTAGGVLPREAVRDLAGDPTVFRLFLLSDHAAVQGGLFVLAGLLGLMLMVGYRTKLAAVLSLIFLVSLQARNPFVCHTGDAWLKILLFWSLFLPLGRCFSLDALKRPLDSDAPKQVFSVASAALLLQIAVFYISAGVLKHQHEVWTSGQALSVFLGTQNYVTPIGTWFASFPALGKFLTYATLVLESLGPLLFFSPIFTQQIRFVMVLVFASFHLGIQLTIHIGLFEVISIVALTGLLPAWFWDSILPRFRVAKRITAWIETTRSRFAAPVPRKPQRRKMPTASLELPWLAIFRDIAAAVCLVLVLVSNYNTYAGRNTALQRPLVDVAAQLGLLQSWTIFTNITESFRGWFQVVGVQEDGGVVDVLRRTSFAGFVRPEDVAKTHVNHNARRYWNVMSKDSNKRIRPDFARHLQREWNEHHETKLTQLAIFQIGGGDPDSPVVRPLILLYEPPDGYAFGQAASAQDTSAQGRAWQAFLTQVSRASSTIFVDESSGG